MKFLILRIKKPKAFFNYIHTKTKNMKQNKLTEEQMISILENNQIDQCSEDQRRQVMNFAFGEEFMASNDKGTLKQEREIV